ncbi:unnamed protein product [Caenorhabditis angaria]|uniref:Kinesin-like protein n=1 Tax=Caenorhabditis angaria TaxID=860376 RepID=A0A9P1IB53_9PELO|nr:unnamed protein product [Caenorhabditis angaria]
MDTTMFTSIMASTKKKHSDLPTNLRVAVRIRPMNATEKKDKCSNIVKVEKFNTSVQCKGKPFGPFFKVFDENATQEDVYKDVVSSQTKKVISGFNCTVFAYGQTGTGKTFTMEGGKGDAKSSKDDTSTGIIPRAVEDIFEQLEASGCEEYSLRVSYVELYNEELFDLLAANTEADDRERLRIYDDPSKKGVIVSGVEEVPVRSRADVYKLLELGAEKRRTAATLMNQRSSRSHSLFMVNVVVRENSISGEELVKQGKLNLVDLAGSENIGRSGAQGNRAKEAGSINQSLLTLGRVIRSLTTNAQHIPYRESKLTRLLQDSLGGSTITSLIATMSPASDNFEESQSTLEYAMRAANIKNKPICNTKVSKKTILKEYSDEIEKLRRDLRAAREKNGVIISEESHEEFQRSTARAQELEEQLNSVVDRLRRFTEDLMHMDEQYKHVFERKCELEDRLRERYRNLAEAEKEIEDKKDEIRMYTSGLEKMYVAACQTFGQAKQMRESADDMKQDLMAHWRKIDEMAASNDKNQAMVNSFAEKMGLFVNQVSDLSAEDSKKEEEIRKTIESDKEVSVASTRNIKSEFQQNASETRELISYLKESGEKIDNNFDKNIRTFAQRNDETIKQNIEKFAKLFVTTFSDAQKTNEILFAKLEAIKHQFEEFRKEVDPLMNELRGSATENMERRARERDLIRESTNSGLHVIMDFCKKMMEQVKTTSENLATKIDESQIADQESVEKTISTIGTLGDVIMSLDDGVGEETCDVCEIKEETKIHFDTNQESMNTTTAEFSAEIAKISTEIQNISSKFIEDASECRSSIVPQFEAIRNKNDEIAENCDKLENEIRRRTENVATIMTTKSSEFVENIGNVIKEANETIASIEYSKVDPKARVPARITAPVLTERELCKPPQPESVLNSGEVETGQEDNDEITSTKQNRRVTTFMRRDSLLDTTNIFSSPTSLLQRRAEIAEEDEEN